MLADFFLSSILSWLPKVFSWAVFLIAFFVYIKNQNLKKTCQVLMKTSIGFRFLYALLLSLGQYSVWSGDFLGRNLLNLPLTGLLDLRNSLPSLFGGRLGYFLFYSWGHFWLNFAVSLLVAVTFWYFLLLLRRSNGRFFEAGEIELGFLSAFIVGWPQVLVFFVSTFLSVILLSFYRQFVAKETHTTFGLPFFIAIFLTLFFGGTIMSLSGLWVLKVGY